MSRNGEDIRELLALLIGPSGIRRDLLLGDRWKAVAKPALHLVGEHEAFETPAMAHAWRSIAAENPLVQVLRLPRAGHLPWMDEPERVVLEVERFLAAAVG